MQPDRKITVGEAKEILTLKNTLWFYGYVAYDDTFGFWRELRYIFRYDGAPEAVFGCTPSKNSQPKTPRGRYVPFGRTDLSRGGLHEDLTHVSGPASSTGTIVSDKETQS